MEVVEVAEFDSPIGAMKAASTHRGLAYVALPHADGRGFAGWLQRNAPGARVIEAFAPNRTPIRQILEFLEAKRERFDLHLDVRGTAFQKAVYEEVAAIDYGQTRSYAEVARAIGRPRAVRAVGAANGANPLPLVVPCHRVVASSGHLQGYAGGLDLKARLLAMEQGAPDPDRLL
ncbi:MAG: methylated-DNA--[protein]-cysteine S-methyltransferase [Myxococcota bacterium]